MDDNLTILLLVAVAILAAVMLTAFGAWTRARSQERLAAAAGGGNDETVALLTDENERLRGTVQGLEERLRVLERIAVDPAERTARDIERLR